MVSWGRGGRVRRHRGGSGSGQPTSGLRAPPGRVVLAPRDHPRPVAPSINTYTAKASRLLENHGFQRKVATGRRPQATLSPTAPRARSGVPAGSLAHHPEVARGRRDLTADWGSPPDLRRHPALARARDTGRRPTDAAGRPRRAVRARPLAPCPLSIKGTFMNSSPPVGAATPEASTPDSGRPPGVPGLDRPARSRRLTGGRVASRRPPPTSGISLSRTADRSQPPRCRRSVHAARRRARSRTDRWDRRCGLCLVRP
jgi:hypothetical protein